MPLLVTIASLLAIAVMSVKKVKGAIIWGILGGAVLYYILGFTIPGFYNGFTENLELNPFAAFVDFGTQSFGKVFTEGFDFSAYLADHSMAALIILIVTTALAFCLVDMFDTLGTLYGACARGNMLTKEGDVPNMEKAMLADAIATTTGAICGTSTVTTSRGILRRRSGGRTYRPFVHGYGGTLFHRDVSQSYRRSDPVLCDSRGSDLRRCTHDERRQKYRMDRSFHRGSCMF